ncbi:NlpC/P60 family protein [Sporosarcina saromensis]|uniref:NlpC/P60 family protein n=1 Tax=Sporosarcina saromensis TaxID=359365 RepID=A0ABU4GCI9_9BACL|nr:NlpC/P60 family protein [Sporosarcina saromensis]MDW0114025.1 NlpC/P60 family protein [Sporosarcina saromensis]
MLTNKYLSKTIVALGLSAALLVSPLASLEASANSSSANIVTTAQKYIGKPYVYAGTSPRGFDCSGYVQYVFKEEGVSLPRTSSDQYSRGTAVSKNNLQAGDLVFFKTSGTNAVSHVGIYIGSGKFIHASTSKGVMISAVNDPYYWGSRYVGAKRVMETSQVTQTSNATTGWVLFGNDWSYHKDGSFQTGWINVKSKWYYLNQSGIMQTGWLLTGSKWYYLNASGEMQTGWNKIGGKWYFHDGSGTMKTGWVKTGGKWYYLYNNGEMAANTKIGAYQLDANGAWIQ